MCLKVMPTPTSTDRAGTGNMESSNERNPRDDSKVELVSKELKPFGMIMLGFEFYEVIFLLLLFFKKKMEVLLHF